MMMSSFPVSPTTSRLTKTNKHGNDLTQSHHCLSTWKRHKGSMTQLDKRLVLSINPLLANLPPSPSPRLDSHAPGNLQKHLNPCGHILHFPRYLLSSIHPFIHKQYLTVLSWLHNPCTEGPNIFSVKLRPLCRTIFIFW